MENLLIASAIATAALLADDMTGIGVIDDPLIVITGTVLLICIILNDGDEDVESLITSD